MIAARPIRVTTDPSQMAAVVELLGGVRSIESPGWSVYDLDSGRVGLRLAEPGTASTTHMAFEVDDLDRWVARTRRAGIAVNVAETGGGSGRRAVVTAFDGLPIRIDTVAEQDRAAARAEKTAPAAQPIRVLPIWYTADVATAAATLEALGAQRRISSDSGNWSDFICPGGGLVAVHAAEHTDVVLGFESGRDLGELAEAYAAAGIEAMLIDETYARTLQVADPDGPAGATIWINEQQTDLYGFSIANA